MHAICVIQFVICRCLSKLLLILFLSLFLSFYINVIIMMCLYVCDVAVAWHTLTAADRTRKKLCEFLNRSVICQHRFTVFFFSFSFFSILFLLVHFFLKCYSYYLFVVLVWECDECDQCGFAFTCCAIAVGGDSSLESDIVLNNCWPIIICRLVV